MKLIIKQIILKIFVFFVKMDFALGAALILSFYTKPMSTNRKYRVLALNRTVFSEDLLAISLATSEICFLSFPRLLLSEYVKKYVNNFIDLNDSTYHKIMDGSKEQEKFITL